MSIRLSCHCGAVAGTLDEAPKAAITCNCSICRRKGSILAAVSPDKFHLATPRENFTTYRFHRHVIRHHFCKTCGCAPFAEGEMAGEPMVAVNLRCAEGLDLSTLTVSEFDGASLP